MISYLCWSSNTFVGDFTLGIDNSKLCSI